MSRSAVRRRLAAAAASRRAVLAAMLALPALPASPALAAPPAPGPAAADAPAVRRGGGAAAGFEVTPPVRQELQRIQQQWLRWVGAADRAAAEAAVGDMLATAGQLGMARLPDLSLGALAWAVEAQRRHD